MLKNYCIDTQLSQNELEYDGGFGTGRKKEIACFV